MAIWPEIFGYIAGDYWLYNDYRIISQIILPDSYEGDAMKVADVLKICFGASPHKELLSYNISYFKCALKHSMYGPSSSRGVIF